MNIDPRHERPSPGVARPARSRKTPACLAWLLALGVLAGSAPCRSSEPDEPRFEIESVRVESPADITAALVMRVLPLRIGQAVTAAELIETSAFLAGSGLFTEVDVYTERGSRPGAIVVVIVARPAARLRLETGLGYDPRRSWYLNLVGLRVLNPFGRGGLFRAGIHEGLHQDGFFLDLEVPSFPVTDLDLLAEGSASHEIWNVHDRDVSYYQLIRRLRLMAGVRRQLRDDLELRLWTGLSATDLDHRLRSNDEDVPTRDAGLLLPDLQEKTGFWESRLELQWDRSDRLRSWQSARWFGCSLNAATSDAGPAFWGADLDARLTMPVAGRSAAAFRYRAVYASPGTPYYMRPFLGGVNSLRGFKMGGLSGPLGARAVWQLSGEWRQPLLGDDRLRPRVIGTLFTDLGQHWDAAGGRQDVAASVGYGALIRIRWLQTLNVEVAYPLTADLTENSVILYLSLGRSF